MQTQFSIEVDPLTSTVSITMSGFFEEADTQRSVACRNAEHLRLRCQPKEHVTLVDVRGMNIQRAAAGRDARFFLSQEEAETWLRQSWRRPALSGVSNHDTRFSAT